MFGIFVYSSIVYRVSDDISILYLCLWNVDRTLVRLVGSRVVVLLGCRLLLVVYFFCMCIFFLRFFSSFVCLLLYSLLWLCFSLVFFFFL